jgi:hypothetical protein
VSDRHELVRRIYESALDEVVGVWSMHDPLPWIEAAGVEDEVIRRRRSPPG